MDFALSEEQQELAGLAARILEDRMDLQHLKARDRSEDWYDLDTWREFAKANLLGIALPESAGGLGLGFVDVCMVLREIGRNVAPLPFIPTIVTRGVADRARSAPTPSRRSCRRSSRATSWRPRPWWSTAASRRLRPRRRRVTATAGSSMG